MSFSKFASLICLSGLWFSRLGEFEDVFEGTYPEANKRLRPEIYGDDVIPQEVYDLIEKESSSIFVSCFHANDYESAAMWSLYSKDEGIAIQTTAGHLKNSFSSYQRDIYLSAVEYIDYEKDFLPEGNSFYLATYKRKSFEHEKEVRCLYSDHYQNPQEKGNAGFNARVDLCKLVNKIYISPYAKPYLEDITRSLVQAYNLSPEIISSTLYTLPR